MLSRRYLQIIIGTQRQKVSEIMTFKLHLKEFSKGKRYANEYPLRKHGSIKLYPPTHRDISISVESLRKMVEQPYIHAKESSCYTRGNRAREKMKDFRHLSDMIIHIIHEAHGLSGRDWVGKRESGELL